MSTALNWKAITAEAVHHLQALLRIDTTNPPGNELAAVEYLAGVLRVEGIDPIVLESAPQRGNVIARLKGDGSLPPLLLYNHLDVVPAEPQHWTHPPFGGDVADGFVWGRGALDMKNVTAMQLMTVLLLKRNHVPLHRDVIFAGTSDEEIDSDVGAEWLIKYHPDLVRAEYGLSEMGGHTLYLEGKRFYPIMCAEKGHVLAQNPRARQARSRLGAACRSCGAASGACDRSLAGASAAAALHGDRFDLRAAAGAIGGGHDRVVVVRHVESAAP